MEKLLELLNEYTKQSYDDYSFFKYMEPTHSFYVVDDGYESYMPEEVILGKRFGFVSWLVENDKIDTNNLSLKAFKNIFSGGGFVEVSDLEVLLMLLAISDTPIEDLISYLR